MRFFLAFALLILWGPSQSQPVQKAPEIKTAQKADTAAKSKQEGEQTKRDTGKPLAISPAPQPGYAKTDSDGKRDEGTEYWTVFGYKGRITDWLLSLFTFCLVTVGIFQGYFFLKTLGATEKAANAAKESAGTAFIANMPVLSPYVTEISKIHPLSSIVFSGSDGIPTVQFDSHIFFTFDNYGKTPGIIREVRADLFLVHSSKLPAVDFDALPPHDHEVIIPGDARNGTGGTSVIDYKKHFSLTQTEFDKLLSEATSEFRRIVLIGRVTYDDFFEMRHTRLFCVWMRFCKLADNHVNAFQGQHGGIDYNRITRQKITEYDR